MFQPPAEYRQAPMETPTRETVAQFWDSPTPFAGLRPEIEQGYLAISKTGTADDILGYAKANGFTIDPTETKRFVDARNHDATVDWRIGYKDQPKPLTNAGDGTTGAMMRGVGTGALAGGLDEAGALVDSLGLTDGRENVWNSDRRWADIWANNQQQNSSILGYDDMAHPYAALGGELAGGLLVPFGAKARTVPQLFRVGAAYGGAEGFLGTDGDIGQRAIGGAVGVPLGGAIGAAGGKALEGLLRVAPRLAARSGLRMPRRAPASPVGEFGPVGAPRLDDVTDGSIRQRDRIDIGDVPESPAAYAPSHPIRPVAPAAGRDRDVIDVNGGDPWAGFKEVRPAMAMDAEPMPSISSPTRERDYFDMGATRPGRMDDPVTEEQRRAIAEGVDPRDVLPILSNEVGSVEEAALRDAGRYTEARPVNEATALEGRLVRSQNGRELPKRGPLDLVTWLRTRGGVKDQGGNLRAMGIDNAPRDLDFARGEQRFGRLVDDDNGMNLDDAAFSAWEAGYLPGHDRPDINAFLDALDRTHSGSQRYFHPDDFPEVEKFEAMRTDRYALEQQLADGPVHVDRSMPAEESQPFPPPEAYEEWPAGGPDFAGNINLNKLSSPQDIKRALDMTQRRVGFDAATRGRVSNVETERLAGELGMTPEALLSRRKGQALNAEEALAARQILAKSGNELVNAAKAIQRLETPGDDAIADFRQKWVRHVAIQEQVAGMTAEAGRALQQFRMAADSRAVQADVLAAIVRGGGGRERIQDAADLILDAIEKGPGKFNVEVERLAKPQFRDKATELYINSLLTGLQTHTTNIASNTLTALAQPVEHAVAAAIGGARQILPGANVDRVIGSEIGQRAFGLLSGAREGARLFWQALKTGESSDFVSKVEGQDMKAISGLKGEIIRIPTRLLTAEDEFFKGIARRMELNGLAARHAYQEGLRGDAAKSRIAELSANPTDDMLHRSMDYARYVTFQQKLGPAMSKISGFTQDVRPMKLFLPFIRTPTNLLKFAVERSPAAPLLKEWRTDFAAGGARRDLAIAKMMVGSGIGMAIYDAALDGRITGSAPTDPAKAKLLYADGWQPYSIRLGDQWYSYKRMDPFSTTLGIAADMALLPDGMSERQREDKGTLLVASVLGNLASKTWLSGISGLVGALTEPDRKADDLLQRTIGSIAVPTGLSQIARTI
ncbi:MAG TPA: hypothetical protein VJM34_14385, partial [Novosphingobium sp.]|nr:hypothetical protein [Novosphingobium sp.]